MTITTETAHIEYIGDGATASYAVPWDVAVPADIAVYRLIDGADVAAPYGADWSLSSGSVVFVTPPPSGQRVSLIRANSLTQPVALSEGGRLYAGTINAALDRLTAAIQRVAERGERAPALPSASGRRNVQITAPAPNAVLVWSDDLSQIRSDANLGPALLTARDQAVASAATASSAAASALASAAAAALSANQAQASADAAAASALVALDAADRAETARDIVLASAERASWALGLMGLANNLTQLLYVVAPFLTKLFGIFKDFGWINQPPQVTVDFGWVCPGTAPTGLCVDYGSVSDPVTVTLDYGDIGSPITASSDYGDLSPVSCVGPAPVECQDDLGWINAVIPLDSDQPISLPIHVPDPCPVIIPTPVDPNPPPPTPYIDPRPC